MSANNRPVQAIEIAYTRGNYIINMNSPLLLALDMMTSHRAIYRLTVTDARTHVKGVISGLRILDTLVGRRGVGIKRRAGKGLEPLLRQPIRLFIHEYLHKLSQTIPLKGLISYIMENKVGHIALVDQIDAVRGIITENCILKRIPIRKYGILISDLMTPNVYTIKSTQTVFDAIEIMSSQNIRRLVILDEGEISGIITTQDLLRHLRSSEYLIDAILTKKEINAFISESIETLDIKEIDNLSNDSDVKEFLSKKRRQQSGFPVVDDEGKILGIITPRDVASKLPRLIGPDLFVNLITIQQNR